MPLSASLITQELTLENGLKVIVMDDRGVSTPYIRANDGSLDRRQSHPATEPQ